MKTCQKCGNTFPDELNFCTECGEPLASQVGTNEPRQVNAPVGQNYQAPNYQDGYQYQTTQGGQQVYGAATNATYYAPDKTSDVNALLPPQYRLISSWGYVGYSLLFSIPIVGLILLIVYAVDSSYICRRNYARSILWMMLIGVVLSILLLVLFGIGFASTMSYYN